VTRIALLGSSETGVQIGCEYALGGCSVVWVAADEDANRRRVEQTLRRAAQLGLAGPAELEHARALMIHGEEASGGERLTLIVEALAEDLGLKADAIAPLAARHPEALVATAGSAISLSELATAAEVGERMFATVYGSPPMLTPLVEIAAARDTPPRLLDRVSQLLRAIGKRPVALQREVPGMISRRLELALLRECMALLEAGVASSETLDEVLRDGLARRWRLEGPLQAVRRQGAEAVQEPAELLAPTLAVGAVVDFGSLTPQPEEASAADRERRDDGLAGELRAERARTAGRATA
jgi:3-hydroxyacyl-CoA dehydrogenase